MRVFSVLTCLLLSLPLGSPLQLNNWASRVFKRRSVLRIISLAPFAPLAASAREGFTKTDSGLEFEVVKEGEGDMPTPGATIKAHYTGWLDDFESGKKFDSSYDRRQPLAFAVGTGRVIKGWDEVHLLPLSTRSAPLSAN